MALPSSFINTSRARTTAFLVAMEDIVALRGEYLSLGGATFTSQFDFAGENTSTYDMTEAQYNAMLAALDQFVTAFNGGTIPASATRQGDLYKGKV
jgi:hypothetical protein